MAKLPTLTLPALVPSARQLSLQQHHLRWRGHPPFQTIESLQLEAISRKPVHLAPLRMEALV